MKSQLAALLLCTVALGQTHHHASPETVAVDLDKIPAPQHIDGIGHSEIKITTKSPEAQQWFNQGLALLHCFWDHEALRAFQQALRLDPDCAMCHWGVSKSLEMRGGNKDQAKAEMAKDKELSFKATDHEQRYIRASADSEDKSGEEATKAFNQEMESLIDHYPGDLDAKLLLALAQGSYDAKGEPRPGALYSQAILRGILHDHPDNAAANHYWIHAVEDIHPEWALESAEKLGRLAPSSGHMVHMPGHIFYRVGDYERARQIFLDARRVDLDYMATQHVSVADDWNYQHNLSYLIANCAEEGRYQEACEYARELEGTVKTPGEPGKFGFYVGQLSATSNRLAIRFAKWDDVIEHPMHFDVPDSDLTLATRSYRDGLVAYARGMKAADANQLDEAERHSTALDAMLWRISQEDLKDAAKSTRDRVLKLLGTASVELRGNIAGRKGDLEAARTLLEQADQKERDLGYSEPPQYSRPALEVLGDACIRSGKFDDARNIYKKVLDQRPHSGWALYGIAASWDKQGEHDEAVKAYREFLGAWSHADQDLPQVISARAYIEKR